MFYEKLMNSSLKKFVNLVDRFYSSYLYMGIVTLFVFLCSIFSFEIPFYYSVAILCGVIPTLICHDDTAALPPLFLCYYSLSRKSYIVDRNDPSYIFSSANLIHFHCFSSIIVACFLVRFLYNLAHKKIHRPGSLFYTFIPYLVMLSIGGFNFEQHQIRDYYYGMGVAASYFLPFCVTTFLVDHDKLKKDYLFALLTCSSLLLCGQTFYCILSNWKSIMTTGFTGDFFRLGWGIKNNLGGMLVMSFAGPLYFVAKGKHYLWFLLLNFVTYGCAILTLSRNAFLVGTFIQIIFFVYSLIALKKTRKILLVVYTVLGAISLFILLNPPLLEKLSPSTYQLLYHFSWDMLFNGREELYQFGYESFLQHPIFGTGYYYIDKIQGPMYTSENFPFRYHNTILQVLASMGAVGMVTYVIHRIDTIIETLRHPNKFSFMILLTIIAFAVLSLGDCHPFIIGPGIFMGVVYGFLDNRKFYQDSQLTILTRGL